MTQIHLISSNNKKLYKYQLESYFKARYQIFVREKGWKSLYRPDEIEIDDYDNDHAVYLIAIDNDKIVGGQRLYPTVLPHMISEVFPHLATRGIPQAFNVFEWTRYFVVKECRTGRTDCRLMAAFQEFCLEEGIVEATAVVEMWWLPRWQQAGFKVRPLGLPSLVEGQLCIAAAIEISSESLNSVRRLAGLRGSGLVRRGKLTPVLDQVPYVAA
jgi:acyl-homoserine lactone synthase